MRGRAGWRRHILVARRLVILWVIFLLARHSVALSWLELIEEA